MRSRYLALWVIVVLVILVGILLWGANRGLDIVDEAWYLLEYQKGTYPFAAVANVFFGWIAHDIVDFRLARLMLMLAAGGILGWGLSLYLGTIGLLREQRPGLPVLMAVVTVGGFVGYTVGPQTLSYNHLVAAALMMTAGLFLAWIANTVKGARVSIKGCVMLSAMGVLLMLAYRVKMPCGILGLAGICTAILMADQPLRWTWRMAASAIVLAAYLGGMLAWSWLFPSPSDNIKAVLSVAENTIGTPYDPVAILTRNLVEVWEVFRLFSIPIGPVFAGCLCLGWLRGWSLRRERPARALTVAVSVGIGALFLFQIWHWRLYCTWAHGMRVAYTPFLILAVAVCLLCGRGWWERHRWRESVKAVFSMQGAGLFVMAVLPIVGVFGTRTGFWANLGYHQAGWFALIVVLLCGVEALLKLRVVSAVLLATLVGLAIPQVMYGFVVKPYMMAGPLWNETEYVEKSPVLKGLRVRPDQEHTFDQLQRLIMAEPRYRAGMPVLALYNMAGLVCALDGVSPGAALYYEYAFMFSEDNCRGVMGASESDLQKAIILNNQPLEPRFDACLRKKGVLFPENYRRIGAVQYADPEHECRVRTVDVYVPNR